MYGLGTIINTAAIVAGGLFGHFFGRLLKESTQYTLNKVCGVSTLFIAISGAMEGMLRVENGQIVLSGPGCPENHPSAIYPPQYRFVIIYDLRAK